MGTKPSVSNPFFARIYPHFSASAAKRGGAEHRARLLAGLKGRVVELGAGDGENFEYYPRTVGELVAVEPEPQRDLALDQALLPAAWRLRRLGPDAVCVVAEGQVKLRAVTERPVDHVGGIRVAQRIDVGLK